MAPNQTKQSFYAEVDRFRYRTNWGCLGWVIVALMVVLLLVWWRISRA